MYSIRDVFKYSEEDMKNFINEERPSIGEYRYMTIYYLWTNDCLREKELVNHPKFADMLLKSQNIEQFYQGLYSTQAAGTNRIVGDINLFDSTDPIVWEMMYQMTMDQKYKKNTRNFTTKISGKPYSSINGELPPIYLIPRERGGPSFKETNLKGVNPEDVQYCCISKGYPMQDLSSFTLGPIVGEGLCLVNAAFSKSICIMHIEGGGVFDLGRKNFWKPAKKPLRNIIQINDNLISVDGKQYNIFEWLKNNEKEWLSQWELWRKSIALCSLGDFHWTRLSNGDDSTTVAYRYKEKYIDFLEWKKECYIKPAYELIPQTKVYQFLVKARTEDKVVLGLVHPMGRNDEEKPITKEFITDLFNSEYEMSCMPFVVAGILLGIKV